MKSLNLEVGVATRAPRPRPGPPRRLRCAAPWRPRGGPVVRRCGNMAGRVSGGDTDRPLSPIPCSLLRSCSSLRHRGSGSFSQPRCQEAVQPWGVPRQCCEAVVTPSPQRCGGS